MKISQAIMMDIPANELIRILNLTVTARTIKKARKGKPGARKRVGWDDEIPVFAKEQVDLRKAVKKHTKEKLEMEAEKRLFRLLKGIALTTKEEMEALKFENKDEAKALKKVNDDYQIEMARLSASCKYKIPKDIQDLRKDLLTTRKFYTLQEEDENHVPNPRTN